MNEEDSERDRARRRRKRRRRRRCKANAVNEEEESHRSGFCVRDNVHSLPTKTIHRLHL